MKCESHIRGVQGEMIAVSDLVARGYDVYRAVDNRMGNDLAVDTVAGPRTVEVRMERAKRYSRRLKRKGDRNQHYAWVARDLQTVTYEPQLPPPMFRGLGAPPVGLA